MQHCPVPRPPRPGDDSRCEHPRLSWLDRSGEVRVLSGQDRTPRSHANPPCAKNPTCRNRTSGKLARVPELHLWLPSFRPLLMLCVSCKHPAQQRSISLPRKAFRRVVASHNPRTMVHILVCSQGCVNDPTRVAKFLDGQESL